MNRFQEIEKQYEHLRQLWLEYWIQDVVFTYQWWIIVFMLIIPFFLWWRLVEKARLIEISIVGLITSSIAFILDQIGSSLGYWTYRYTLTHLERDMWAVADFSILPFFYMMIYQWFPMWKTYIIGTILFALFSAFVGEPIFQWLGIYVMLNWKHIYSFLGYILLGLFVKFVLQRLKTLEADFKNKEKYP